MALIAGGSAAALGPGGCARGDDCSGAEWCVLLDDARMWPIGQPELAEPVQGVDGGPPQGCRCFDDREVAVLFDHEPAADYEDLLDELQQDARYECADVVPSGYDYTCFIVSGPDAPEFSAPFGRGDY